MKALSIKQPWLYAITDLDKTIENRTWKPPTWLLGNRIALHASKKYDGFGRMEIKRISGIIPLAKTEVPCGCIVATAKIVGWLKEDGFGNVPTPCYGHLLNDKWFFGPIGWILEDVRKLKKPIPYQGMLGLWDVPQEISQALIEV